MANHTSSKKAIRQITKRTAINKNRMSRIRTYIRSVEEAIDAKKATEAAAALQTAQKELLRGVTKGLLHKNMASRKISRLAHRIKAIAG
ncbi:MAG: 30S ribosomal protein S20 [Alphaproteobacteria bacterium]|nr:30S ribosomal protein S20 [Alphaproteobacteria bacterium]